MATPSPQMHLSGLARQLILEGALQEEDATKAQEQANKKKMPLVSYLVEQKLVDALVLIYNLVNAIIYHHLSVMELFESDEKFEDYLSDLVIFSLKYFLKQ